MAVELLENVSLVLMVNFAHNQGYDFEQELDSLLEGFVKEYGFEFHMRKDEYFLTYRMSILVKQNDYHGHTTYVLPTLLRDNMPNLNCSITTYHNGHGSRYEYYGNEQFVKAQNFKQYLGEVSYALWGAYIYSADNPEFLDTVLDGYAEDELFKATIRQYLQDKLNAVKSAEKAEKEAKKARLLAELAQLEGE